MLGNECGGCVQAMGMMKNLTPEQKRMYAAMAQNMHSGGGGGATPASAASTSAGTRAAMPAAAGAMQPDAQQAAGMMRDMSPEQVHPSRIAHQRAEGLALLALNSAALPSMPPHAPHMHNAVPAAHLLTRTSSIETHDSAADGRDDEGGSVKRHDARGHQHLA